MRPLRQAPLPPRERTFAQVFPWRNVRRAVMLLALIVVIVGMKRTAGRFLAGVTEWFGPIAPAKATSPR
jgi:hypothetical protein